MANSRRFRQLKSELRRLREHFLPRNWDPTGTYSERKLDRARAYRILAHAEMEAFVEEILLDVVEEKYAEWCASKKPSSVIICLVAASKLGWQDVETEGLDLTSINSPKIKKDDDSIDQMITRAVEQYRLIAEDNNGIKIRNLKRLLMPVGIALSDLDQTWLNNMNSFGGKRGFVAHKSRLGMRNLPDPRSENSTVNDILIGLQQLDEMILTIRRG